jgi:hypothetical protein
LGVVALATSPKTSEHGDGGRFSWLYDQRDDGKGVYLTNKRHRCRLGRGGAGNDKVVCERGPGKGSAYVWEPSSYPARPGAPEEAKGEAKEATPEPKISEKRDKDRVMADETAGNNREPEEGMVALIYNKASAKHRLVAAGDALAVTDSGDFGLDNYWHLEKIKVSTPYYDDREVG